MGGLTTYSLEYFKDCADHDCTAARYLRNREASEALGGQHQARIPTGLRAPPLPAVPCKGTQGSCHPRKGLQALLFSPPGSEAWEQPD